MSEAAKHMADAQAEPSVSWGMLDRQHWGDLAIIGLGFVGLVIVFAWCWRRAAPKG